jgi:glycosyltransferase involved in cell wall biosynthesis
MSSSTLSPDAVRAPGAAFERLRVLHIISGLEAGGAEAALCRLCLASAGKASNTVVSVTGEGYYAPMLRSAGLAVHALGMEASPGGAAAIGRLRRMIRAVAPDVVQTWLYHGNLIGGLAARLAGHRRIVWGLRNSILDPERTRRTTRWVARACALTAGSLPVRIVSCSHAAAAQHIATGYPAERMVVIANGYDCEVFRPDPAKRERVRSEWGIPADMPLLGLVARFDPQKDVNNLLDALVLLRAREVRFTCVLVGSGMDAASRELTAAVAARNLAGAVRPIGFRPDVPAVMAAIDINVLPSAYGEAMPNVVAEAMACGTPAVVTDVGDAASMVGETGWVVPPRDSAALAGAIEAALVARADRARWAGRQQACRDRIVSRYGLDRMVEEYLSVWADVAAHGR